MQGEGREWVGGGRDVNKGPSARDLRGEAEGPESEERWSGSPSL
ncbi:MAG: hypothetical protein RI897_4211 [Verrucomicrobiota bacterium]|jgi:hypothetical protein